MQYTIRKTGIILAVLVLLTVVPAAAQDGIDFWKNTIERFKERSGLDFGGWVEGVIYRNQYGQEDVRGYDYSTGRQLIDDNSGNTSQLGRVKSTKPQVNQAWFFVRRELNTENGFDWGFRADVAYGTDMNRTQAWNDRGFDWDWGGATNLYYASIPRLYAQVGYRGFKIKGGKFDSLLGYEKLDAPESFFVSRSIFFNNGIGNNHIGNAPLFTPGILAEYTFRDRLTLYAGRTWGNDTWFTGGFGDRFWTGGVKAKLLNSLELSYMFADGREYIGGGYRTAEGDLEWREDSHISTMLTLGKPNSDKHKVYMHTVNLTWNPHHRFTNVLSWNFQSSKFSNQPTSSYTLSNGVTRHYGLLNHSYFRFSKKWAVGLRLEWFHTFYDLTEYNNVRFDSYYDDYYSGALALQWKPHKNLRITGEVRYDKVTCVQGRQYYSPYNRGKGDPKNSQWSGGLSVLLHF